MNDRPASPLIDVAWLTAHRHDPGLVILDASWHMPASGRDGAAEFLETRIPGARFFDFDRRICDRRSPLPHMLPSPEDFEREVRALGVNADSTVVCYDSAGIFSAPRAWWMFRAMGHVRVHVLDGGLPAWRAAGLPLAGGASDPVALGDFRAVPDRSRVLALDEVRAAIDAAGHVILDARSAGRFAGRDPEPRPGLRGGHIPGSRNLPFPDLLDGGRYRARSALAKIIEALAPAGSRVICTCGSGVSACVLAVGVELLGGQAAVYDGSWTEWGAREDTPIATGTGDPSSAGAR